MSDRVLHSNKVEVDEYGDEVEYYDDDDEEDFVDHTHKSYHDGGDDEDDENLEEDEEDEDEEEDDEEDDDGNGQHRPHHPSNVNNDLIINTLSDFVSSNHSPNSANSSNEDLPTYKAKMKILLEQLMLKLEEDVDYQKNLESQIDELEKELLLKEQLIESLSAAQDGHNSNQHKDSFHELNEEWHAKVSQEKNKRLSLEKIVLRLQNENAKLHSDLRIAKLAHMNPNIRQREGLYSSADPATTSLASASVISPSAPNSSRKSYNSSSMNSVPPAPVSVDSTGMTPPMPPATGTTTDSHSPQLQTLQRTVNELNLQLQQAHEENNQLKYQREVEMKTMLSLANNFQTKLDFLIAENGLSVTSLSALTPTHSSAMAQTRSLEATLPASHSKAQHEDEDEDD